MVPKISHTQCRHFHSGNQIWGGFYFETRFQTLFLKLSTAGISYLFPRGKRALGGNPKLREQKSPRRRTASIPLCHRNVVALDLDVSKLGFGSRLYFELRLMFCICCYVPNCLHSLKVLSSDQTKSIFMYKHMSLDFIGKLTFEAESQYWPWSVIIFGTCSGDAYSRKTMPCVQYS